MKKEYLYKQPLSLLFIGLICIGCCILFASMMKSQEVWISIIFGILILIMGSIGSLSLYTVYNNFTSSTLKIDTQSIELPVPQKKRIKISLSSIKNVCIVSTHIGKVIEINTKSNQTYLIEQNWMKKKDFQEVSNLLNDWKI